MRWRQPPATSPFRLVWDLGSSPTINSKTSGHDKKQPSVGLGSSDGPPFAVPVGRWSSVGIVLQNWTSLLPVCLAELCLSLNV